MNKRTQILIFGSVVGAAIGLLAGILVAVTLDRRRSASVEMNGIVSAPRVADWLKFIVAAVLLVRQFAGLLAPAKE